MSERRLGNTATGTIEISFTADITKKELLEKFSEFMFMTGTINLVNAQGEEVELDVHGIEYTEFDEESDY